MKIPTLLLPDHQLLDQRDIAHLPYTLQTRLNVSGSPPGAAHRHSRSLHMQELSFPARFDLRQEGVSHRLP